MAWLLGLLLLVSGLLRIPGLNHVPPELFGDEIDVGYQAYSLLKTGKDIYSQPLPFYIHSLAEWRAPLLMYATVPTIALLGPGTWGVRLPEAIFGTLAPIIIFLTVYQTSRSRSMAFLSALALSFMPWHIHYSRVAFEVVLMLNLILLGTLLYLRRRFITGSLFFVLSMYTYSTAVVFTPIWAALVMVLYLRRFDYKAVAFAFFLLIPLIINIFSGQARDRFGVLSIASNPETINRITDLRAESPGFLERFFHNRPESLVNFTISNYLRSFSSEFLFVRGDPIYRHNLQIIGELLPLTAPFILLGMFYLFKTKNYIWLAWLFLAPIPAMLTRDGGYHATRLFLMIPPWAVATGAGLFQAIGYVRPRWRFIAIGLLTLVFSIHFIGIAHYYLVHYSRQSWRWWQVGYEAALIKIADIDHDYSQIFINNTYEPSLLRFAFWTNLDPHKFQEWFKNDKPQPEVVTNYDGFSLSDRYYFGQFTEAAKKIGIPNLLQTNTLYLISQRDDVAGDWDWRTSPPAGVKVIFTSTNAYNQPIFYLITKI